MARLSPSTDQVVFYFTGVHIVGEGKNTARNIKKDYEKSKGGNQARRGAGKEETIYWLL
jgi:hypothetical protein